MFACLCVSGTVLVCLRSFLCVFVSVCRIISNFTVQRSQLTPAPALPSPTLPPLRNRVEPTSLRLTCSDSLFTLSDDLTPSMPFRAPTHRCLPTPDICLIHQCCDGIWLQMEIVVPYRAGSLADPSPAALPRRSVPSPSALFSPPTVPLPRSTEAKRTVGHHKKTSCQRFRVAASAQARPSLTSLF